MEEVADIIEQTPAKKISRHKEPNPTFHDSREVEMEMPTKKLIFSIDGGVLRQGVQIVGDSLEHDNGLEMSTRLNNGAGSCSSTLPLFILENVENKVMLEAQSLEEIEQEIQLTEDLLCNTSGSQVVSAEEKDGSRCENVDLDIENMQILFLEDEVQHQSIPEDNNTISNVIVESLNEAEVSEEVQEVEPTPGQNNISENVQTQDLQQEVPKTRKRKRNVKNWKANKRRELCQGGKAYVSKLGKHVKEKSVSTRKDCFKTCKYNCSRNITEEERRNVFKHYYSLNRNEKYYFISNTTENLVKGRTYPKKESSRRTYTFKYYFNIKTEKIQVCKTFYLSTLAISQKPVYNVHQKKNLETGFPKKDERGKKGSARKISEEQKAVVVDHINSFPKVESHYCRADSKKEYLDPNLNIKKMYDLYKNKCTELNVDAVKESMYRYIFCNEFNLEFQKCKKDLCTTCERHNISKKYGDESESDVNLCLQHISMKEDMRKEKDRDKKNNKVPILCFDLQNVISLPRTNIGNWFYKSKLTCYNLTGHLSTTKTVYNAIWAETTAGRGGNELASAFLKILERIARDNNITELVVWSDSCVAQNRNSMISNAILYFMRNHPEVISITMKYFVAGHSCVQEIDNAHSQLEKKIKITNLISPLTVVRAIRDVNRNHPFIVLQMQNSDFLNFATTCKSFCYKNVPFTKVYCMKFTQCFGEVEYSSDYKNYATVNIKQTEKVNLRKGKNTQNVCHSIATALYDFQPKVISQKIQLSEKKREALSSMLDCIKGQDLEYYKLILGSPPEESVGSQETMQNTECLARKTKPTKKLPKKNDKPMKRLTGTKNSNKKTVTKKSDSKKLK